MRKRLTTAARCAIKMRSAELDAKRGTELLRQDLRNGPLHCFGIHSYCSTDYCKIVCNSNTTTATNASISTSTQSEESTLEDREKEPASVIASQEKQFCRDAIDEETEAVHSVAPELPANVDPQLVWDIQHLVGRLISKADKLIGK